MANVQDAMSSELKTIFKLKKTSYAEPGPVGEQECLFINVEKSTNSVRDREIIYRIQGSCVVYSTNEKLPLGYFSKCIQEAKTELTKNFHFYELEKNTRQFADKVQRDFSFVYFFKEQYDPEKGSIEEIEFTTEEY